MSEPPVTAPSDFIPVSPKSRKARILRVLKDANAAPPGPRPAFGGCARIVEPQVGRERDESNGARAMMTAKSEASGGGFAHRGNVAGERFGFKGRHVREVPLHDAGVYLTVEDDGRIAIETSPVVGSSGPVASRMREAGLRWNVRTSRFRGVFRADDTLAIARAVRAMVEVLREEGGL